MLWLLGHLPRPDGHAIGPAPPPPPLAGWLAHCEALQDGLSVRKVAAHLGVHRTTTLRRRDRFLRCPAKINVLAMRGVVEADETKVLESFKGQRKAPALTLAQRPSRRRSGKARKRGLSSEPIPILVLRARTGQTADFVLPAAPDKGAVKAVMASAVADDAVLRAGGIGLLASAARALGIEHQPVNLSKSQQVRGAWRVARGTSRRSTPTRVDSSSGCAASTPWPIPASPTTWAGSERSTVEGPVLKPPHGCSRWQSKSEVIISQREQSQTLIVLQALPQHDSISRIVLSLSRGNHVTTGKNNINCVVTEFSAAQLRGKSARQRALEMIGIAHPKFRAELTEQRKR